jgi:ParB family chromosome partitioning protein
MRIPLNKIDPPVVYMRTVDRESIDFFQLCDSIQNFGQHNSILVRPVGDRYQLVDGAYRLAAHEHLRIETIEATVRDMSDTEVLLVQVQANVLRPETSRIEFAKQLMRIQHAMPAITLAQLAKFAGRQPYWVRQQLDLLDLRLEYQTMADRGQLSVLNAYSLSRLPAHIQGRYIEQALNMEPEAFRALIAPEIQRLQMNAKDRSEATRIAAATSEPQPYLRQLKDMTSELRTCQAAKGLIAEAKPTNMTEAFRLGVQWALNVDPLSLETRKAHMAKKHITRIIEKEL